MMGNGARTTLVVTGNVPAQCTHCLGLIRDDHHPAAACSDPVRQIIFVSPVRLVQVDRQLFVTDMKVSQAQENLFLDRPGIRGISEPQVQNRIAWHIGSALNALQIKLVGNRDKGLVLHGLAPLISFSLSKTYAGQGSRGK
jgi:hypothetical protein